jgi:hypothetical protein
VLYSSTSLQRRRPNAANDDLRFDTPLYTVAEAARALGVSPSPFATWAKGYTRLPSGKPAVTASPVVTAIKPLRAGTPTIPFIGLAEGIVLAAVRGAGVSLQRILPALMVLANNLGVDHALASRRLFTDGADSSSTTRSNRPTRKHSLPVS